jgi:ATPase subunit of ABC transporter with duplicated ATPase domains
MNSLISKLLILLALTAIVSTDAMAAKGSSGGTTTPVVEPDKAAKDAEKEAEKKAKEEAKAKEKAQKEADKLLKDAAKKTDRIELLAKMKSADPADAEVESEDEASLKYRSRGTKLQLTAEVEGFTDGDVLKMYVVINNAEVLVASLELIGEGEAPPRQEIEFD